jgi:hypothetical protein
MTPEAQRIAIAQACPEIIKCRNSFWFYLRKDENNHPYWEQCYNNDPLSDLNVTHEAEKVLDENQKLMFMHHVAVIVGWDNGLKGLRDFADYSWAMLHSTTAQRAEAFLKTLNLWKPDLSPDFQKHQG